MLLSHLRYGTRQARADPGMPNGVLHLRILDLRRMKLQLITLSSNSILQEDTIFVITGTDRIPFAVMAMANNAETLISHGFFYQLHIIAHREVCLSTGSIIIHDHVSSRANDEALINRTILLILPLWYHFIASIIVSSRI